MMSRGKKRTVWAIKHRHGVSLINAKTGVQAVRRAAILLGKTASPFVVMDDQDQNIAMAKIEGAEVLDVVAR